MTEFADLGNLPTGLTTPVQRWWNRTERSLQQQDKVIGVRRFAGIL